jgi:putative ABC transport system permease protein
VRAELGKRLRFNPADERALNINDSVENMKEIGGITTGLKVVLSFIGVLTLAIGGVGIMNIMFVNVQERTREIGVRKALGAKRREILLQFLLEGLAITSLGGSPASPVRPADRDLQPAAVPRRAARRRHRRDRHPLVLSMQVLAVCAGILMTVGLVAVFVPAWRASRVHPIESLRYE